MSNILRKKGFVLLYALLVAGVVLAIGMSLSGIISKQIQLSSIGRMSRVAYYAADSGRGCGMFWWKYGGTSISGTDPDANIPNSIIYENSTPADFHLYCQDSNTSVINKTWSNNPGNVSVAKKNFLSTYDVDWSYLSSAKELSFDIDFSGAAGSPACAKVTVLSFPTNTVGYTGYKVIVLSSGFSASCTTVNSGSGNRVVSRTLVDISKTTLPGI
jgi:hypothetical protein